MCSSDLGATLFLNLDSNNDWNDKFVITPYYRFYFSKSEDFGSKGFFAEVFSKFAFGEARMENYFDIAPGLAVGSKWINRKGFTFEILFGLGRNLLYDNESEKLTKYFAYNPNVNLTTALFFPEISITVAFIVCPGKRFILSISRADISCEIIC